MPSTASHIAPATGRFPTIERKLLVPLAAIFAAVAGVVAWLVTAVVSGAHERTLASEALIADDAQSFVRRLAAAGADAPVELRRRLAEEVPARVRVALGLVVAGEPPRVVVSSQPEWEGLLLSQLPDAEVVEDLGWVIATHSASVETYADLHQSQGMVPIGADGAALVRLAAADRTGEVMHTALKISAVTTAGFAVLAVLTTALVRTRVTRPLARIAADDWLRGVLPDGRDASATDDEIAALAEAIDAARAREARSFAEIERLALVARKTTNAVLISDEQGRVVWVNEGFSRLTGYTLEEFARGGSGHILQGIDAPRESAERMRASIARGEPCRAELFHHAKDGRGYWVDIEIQPMRNGDGAPTGFMAIESDVTSAVRAREKMAESERRQKLAVEGADLGTWDWNLSTGQVVFNERWCRMLGYEPEEVAPTVELWRSAIHADDRRRVLAMIEDHFAGKSDFVRCEYRLRCKDGRVIWVHDSGKVYERDAAGKPLRMAGIHLDITERRRAEERFELAVKGSSAGIWDWDVITNKNFMSARFKEMLGYPADYPMDSYDGWADLLHPEDRDGVLDALWAHVRTGSPYSLDYRLKHRSGEWRWYHAHGQAEWDSDGKPLRMAGSLEDIHERRVAEQARARLAAIVDGSEDSILGVSLEGQIQSVNAAAARMFGVEAESLVGKFELDGVPEAHRAHESAALARVSRGERVEQYESRRRRADGTTVEVSVSVSPVFDAQGRVVAASKIVRDISERSEKRELVKLNVLLGSQNRKLAEMTERAHRFVDDVSHEFRTPLTVIREYSSIIAEGLGGAVSPQQAEWLQVIDVATVDLNQMVEDFLDSSKLRAGRLRVDRRASTPRSIVAGVRRMIARKAASRKIRVIEEIPHDLPAVFADEEKVRRVIMNLMSNAIKFSPDGAEIVLSARALPAGDIEFAVRDHGPGLSPSDVALLFERFRQLPNALAPSVKGFGLGLNIARQLVWLNLGRISVASAPNEGATFSFTLPSMDRELILERFFDRLAEREEPPQLVALLRVAPSDGTNIEQLRRMVVATTRPSDIVLESGDGRSLLLFGPAGCARTWHSRVVDGIARSAEQKSGGGAVSIVGSWPYPGGIPEARAAIAAGLGLESHAAV